MTDLNFKKRFGEIADLIQTEFERNTLKYGDKIKCKKGCSQCCSQIFKITNIDGIMISEFVKTLSPEIQTALKEKSKSYIGKSQNLKIEKRPEEFFKTPELPCPALGEEGECLIYEARPVICRRFGPPVYDYKNPGKLYACELNFSDGEEITDDELIPLQTEIGIKWDNLKSDFNLLPENKKIASTNIAEAILKAVM